MLKKSLAVFLMASILLLSFFSVPAFAYESEDDFDISDYTWEDIMTMSNEEFHELLSNFERVYDPFGTYETNPLTVDNKSPFNPIGLPELKICPNKVLTN